MLQGLRVIELATYIAAPGASGILADWGADVVKVEAPGGDPIRQFFDTIGVEGAPNPVFDMDNRSKRAIAVDITSEGGREVMHALLRDADIFITNVRPGALARAGFDPDTLMAAHPHIIYASISGYGLDGPDANKPGFDLATFWARAGVASLTTPKGAEPFPLRTGFGDHVCSLAAVSGILAAVHKRTATGKGSLVEASLLRSAIYAMASDFAIQMRMGKIGSTRPRRDAISPLANFFKTSDERWICLLPRQGAPDWPNIVRAAGRPELLDDERFKSNRLRRDNGAALVDLLDEGFARMTFDEAAARLEAEDVAWAPVQTPREVVTDPQAIACGAFVEVADGAGGVFKAPASPIRFDHADDPQRTASPKLGQHTDEVLAAAGYSAAEIAALREKGAIA